MTKMTKLVSNAIILSMMFVGSTTFAEDITGDTVPTDLTVEKRIYQHDGFGAQWALDVGSDGLWFVNKEPVDGNYSAALKIDNNASANALVVGSSIPGQEGNVGIGTDEPQAPLEVNREFFNTTNDGFLTIVGLTLNNTNTDKVSDPGFELYNKRENFKWIFRTYEASQGFTATKLGTGGGEMTIGNTTNDYRNATLEIGGKTIFEDGKLVTASSRKLKDNIVDLNTKEAMDAFHNLKPVSYVYKTHRNNPVVGFIAEDMPDLLAMPSRKTFDSSEVVAVLTKVLQEQENMLKQQALKIEKLEKMQKRLVRVETLLTNLALETSAKEANKITLK